MKRSRLEVANLMPTKTGIKDCSKMLQNPQKQPAKKIHYPHYQNTRWSMYVCIRRNRGEAKVCI